MVIARTRSSGPLHDPASLWGELESRESVDSGFANRIA